MKERMIKIVEILNNEIHEREETISVSFLAALSGQNIFLFGPPGTAKSLIARRLSHAFETSSYFEYLMHRFSTPEEVFGPVSITELKKDNFVRKTEGFLPQSDFAFLDEIWKSSPSILNTLLTIINEKSFRNGAEIEFAPLKALIAASNETPPPGQGLEALYDRFLIRLDVSPMEEKANFESLLKSQPTSAALELPIDLKIKHEEWKRWSREIHKVKLSEETLNIIHDIRLSFAEKGEELDVYVSDRRWQKAAILLKAAAFFSGRKETNLVDTLLLRHCLWTTKDNYSEIVKIVENAVRNCGFETGVSLHGIDYQKAELEREITEELYYSEDVYETEILNDGNEYFKCVREWEHSQHSYHGLPSIRSRSSKSKRKKTFYILVNRMNSKDEFHPIDRQGNELDWINCNFNSQGICSIKINQYGEDAEEYYLSRSELSKSEYWQKIEDFSPKILFYKGVEKSDVNQRLIESLKEAVLELNIEIENIEKIIETRLAQLKKELETPFISKNIRNIALESVEKQLQDVKVRHLDCDRLKKKVDNYEQKIN